MVTKTKSALGKGMGALLGQGTSPLLTSEGEQVQSTVSAGAMLVPIHKVRANKEQPRKIFKDKELLELSVSIKENGVIQPITVTPAVDGIFTIIAGERRFRASKLAGLDSVPVLIKKSSKKEILAMAIIENVQRSDLNCVEEALAYYQLMNEFSLTQEEVAKKIGKERSTIANFLRLLKLPREVIQLLQREQLSFGHGKILASVKEDERAKRLARVCVEETLSVRELEKLAKSTKNLVKNEKNKFLDEKVDALKKKLETKTGFHFDLKTRSNGAGSVTIKFGDEAEFNNIYQYLMKK